jgi:hypothetical protein
LKAWGCDPPAIQDCRKAMPVLGWQPKFSCISRYFPELLPSALVFELTPIGAFANRESQMSDISENRIGSATASAPPYTSPPSSQEAAQPDLPASDKLSELKDKAAEDVSQIRQVAADQAQAAMDTAAETAAEQKNVIARQLSGVAQALEKVGSELERGDQRTLGQYTRDLGSSAKRIAEDIRDRDLGEVAAIAEDFGRRQPAAFLGLAALAGFAASRFVTASAQRQTSSQRASNSGTYGRQPGAMTAEVETADLSNTGVEGGYHG